LSVIFGKILKDTSNKPMRADRLISIILLLQTRGNFSARQLAEELEVSERTIYRDIEALSQAGIPVYTIRGPGGGVFLIENYRTSLTGLTNEQLQALFMLNIPQPLIQLGAGEALKTALLKLTASLPATRTKEEEHARQRFYLDWESEPAGDYPVPYLEIIRQGVWQDRCIHLKYKPHFWAVVDQVVEPLGLIAKGNAWHLVCMHGDHLRALRIDSVFEAQLLEEHFTHPEDFNLAEFWHTWQTGAEASRPSYPVKVRVAPPLAENLPRIMGDATQCAVQDTAVEDVTGWTTYKLNFISLEAARNRLITFGGAIEVLEPEALRLSIADYARQTMSIYTIR
jgi:predicted DNA-binding transcriptional regulator YafY